MTYLYNISRIHNCWNRFGIEYEVWDMFHAVNNWKSRNYPREKILEQRNTHEKKSWTHEIPTRINFGPTKYPRENIQNPRNTHEGTSTMERDLRNLAHSKCCAGLRTTINTSEFWEKASFWDIIFALDHVLNLKQWINSMNSPFHVTGLF